MKILNEHVGGPAFPFTYRAPDSDLSGKDVIHVYTGMTLRDWFAGQVLGDAWVAHGNAHRTAQSAYAVADAMLAERAKEKGQ